ncbi:TPA: hypothetical protein ACPOYD_000669 [Haemophilus influenzae]
MTALSIEERLKNLETQISFYRQVAEHYAQQLFESQAQTAQFLSETQDGGATLYRYLRILHSNAESTREFLATQPDTVPTLIDAKHHFYSYYLAHLERLEKTFKTILPDILIDLTLHPSSPEELNVLAENVVLVLEKEES